MKGTGFKMQYFFETVESLKDAKIKNVGFEHFDSTHLLWLLFCAVCCTAVAILYKKLSDKGRKRVRLTLASLLLLDELYKVVFLIIGVGFTAKYLPLHLCSINIFLIAIHVIKPTKAIENFLYSICIPSAVFALVIPTWTELPFLNFMHLHSFTVHILLLMYPLVLFIGGDIKPRLRDVPKTIVILLIFAVIAYIVNVNTTGTNFMFLKSASDIAPLVFFKKLCGSHLVGFPVLLGAVLAFMYAPIYTVGFFKKRANKT